MNKLLRHAILLSMARRRGNPKWSSGYYSPELRPAVPTEFETQACQLGLKEENYASSIRLRRWCEQNRHRCYIPEWLLETWKIPVDHNLG